MAPSNPTSRQIRFGEFILDLDTAELRKNGYLSILQGQPFQILQILIERPGSLVTRDELKKRLWPSDTFVDFDQGLNKAVKRLREALEDSADHPKFIETLPRRGYRFIAQVTSRELASGARATTSSTTASIAVLPFTNMSADPENEFFADGITEEIINALTQIEDLRVAARTSAFYFKGKHVDLHIIGERLKVKTVLEGSVRKAGNRVRIMAQLVNVIDGYHLWSERYDRELKDIFEIQDDISRAIADRLKVSLKSSQQLSTKAATRNLEGYELYLKGRELLYRRGQYIRQALQCFERAVGLDPQYALAWSGLADARSNLGIYGFERPEATMPQAREAALRAVALDPALAEGHCSLASIYLTYDWEWTKAEEEFLRALELSPRYENLAWYALFYLVCARGRFDEGIAIAKKAVEIDPLSGYAHAVLAYILSVAGKAAEAVQSASAAVELGPAYFTYGVLALVQNRKGEHAKSLAAAEMALALSGRYAHAVALLALPYAAMGKMAAAKAIYAELSARAAHEYVQPFFLAVTASAAGEADKAFGHLYEAVEIRDPILISAKCAPQAALLREDPRFDQILARIHWK